MTRPLSTPGASCRSRPRIATSMQFADLHVGAVVRPDNGSRCGYHDQVVVAHLQLEDGRVRLTLHEPNGRDRLVRTAEPSTFLGGHRVPSTVSTSAQGDPQGTGGTS